MIPRQTVRNGPGPARLSAALMAVSVVLCLLAAEAFLRVKNSANDPSIDFDHVTPKAATLQYVDVRLNTWGLRGPEPAPLRDGERRILFLGGSITLGWGSRKPTPLRPDCKKCWAVAGEPAQVLNGGVCNYVTERYVSRFFKELAGLKPTDIVVHYFLRDAERLWPGGGSFVLRHSQLAVTLWIAYHRLLDCAGEMSPVGHYRAAYAPDAPGFVITQRMLGEFAAYAKQNNIRGYGSLRCAVIFVSCCAT